MLTNRHSHIDFLFKITQYYAYNKKHLLFVYTLKAWLEDDLPTTPWRYLHSLVMQLGKYSFYKSN